MQSSSTVQNPRTRNGQKWSSGFDLFVFNPWLRNCGLFNKFKTANIIVKMIFFSAFSPAKAVIYERIHLRDLAGFLVQRNDKRPDIFPPFKQV